MSKRKLRVLYMLQLVVGLIFFYELKLTEIKKKITKSIKNED